MSDTWTEEEYYEEPYYDEYYSKASPRTWPTWALAVSGCLGLAIGFACAACAVLILGGGFLLSAPASSGPVSYQPQTARDWAEVIRSAGLEVENTRELTQVGDQLPPGSVSGIRFDMPSYCADCSGELIMFETPQDVSGTVYWLQSLGQYAYGRETVLLQIDGRVPQEVASQYQTVFMEY